MIAPIEPRSPRPVAAARTPASGHAQHDGERRAICGAVPDRVADALDRTGERWLKSTVATRNASAAQRRIDRCLCPSGCDGDTIPHLSPDAWKSKAVGYTSRSPESRGPGPIVTASPPRKTTVRPLCCQSQRRQRTKPLPRKQGDRGIQAAVGDDHPVQHSVVAARGAHPEHVQCVLDLVTLRVARHEAAHDFRRLRIAQHPSRARRAASRPASGCRTTSVR